MNKFTDSKLVKLLRLLDADEFKELGKWLASPWCNSNKKLYVFYQVIKPYTPEYISPKLKKDIIFKKLYPGKPFESGPFNNLMREFVKSLEKFLIHRRLNKMPFQRQLLLKDEYLERKQTELFYSYSGRQLSGLNSKEIKTGEDYLYLHLLSEQLYFHPDKEFQYSTETESLRQANSNLDLYYAITKYRYLHEIKSRKPILENSESDLTDGAISTFLFPSVEHPIIDLYQIRLNRSEDWGLEDFQYFFSELSKKLEILPKREQQIFLFSGINDTVELNSQGESRALPRMLDLYKLGLKNKLLLIDGHLSKATYNNIVLVASILRDIPLLENFINEYTNFLPVSIQHQASTWAESQQLYSKGAYQECLDHLFNYNFKDPIYIIQAKVTLLKAFYDQFLQDQSYYKPLKSYCDAFKKYIYRNELYSKEKRGTYKSFIKYTLKIATAVFKKKNGKQKLEAVMEKIEKDKNLFGRRWLKQKIEEQI